jgi:hypothetical protein
MVLLTAGRPGVPDALAAQDGLFVVHVTTVRAGDFVGSCEVGDALGGNRASRFEGYGDTRVRFIGSVVSCKVSGTGVPVTVVVSDGAKVLASAAAGPDQVARIRVSY